VAEDGDDLADSHELNPFPVVKIPPSDAAGNREVIDFLLGQLVALGSVRAETVPALVRQIHQREALGSTAIGKGVAIPHCKTDTVASVVGIIGESAVGIPWADSKEGRPVFRVCLLVLPERPTVVLLRTLERLARQLQSEGV
jgi:mannitol/fructose-specific phosphotransferase system IIA component (Ntr-type)